MFSWPEVTGSIRKDYDGLTYVEREHLKQDAWKAYGTSQNITDKSNAIENVIMAHYDRSRESYRGKHPEFSIYAQHWLHAQQDLVDSDTIEALVKKYGVSKKPMISKGRTYWRT